MFQIDNKMRSAEVPKAVVVMTDGRNDKTLSSNPAESFHDNNITVAVVGIGDEVDVKELQKLLLPDHYVHLATDFDDLLSEAFLEGIIICVDNPNSKPQYIYS